MTKYRIRAQRTTWFEDYVEADDEYEAYEIAQEWDGDDFTEVHGEWEIEVQEAE